MNRSRVTGTKFETALSNYFNASGYPSRRLTLHGAKDIGDLYLTTPQGQEWPIEAKAAQAIDLAGWSREALAERDLFCSSMSRDPDVPATLIVKARGKSVGKAYVVMELDDWLRQIVEKM